MSGDASEADGVADTAAPPLGTELKSGDVIDGRYRVQGALGTGGIGVVYRAVQLPLERPVAIKVLHDDLLSLSELRQRFEREARALSALAHPHVVSISDYGIDGERPYLVMELLEGDTLEAVLARGPLDPERGLRLARQVLLGLASAHEKGIAHRDLKPANVFLSRLPDGSEHVKLLDFGLARIVSAEDDEEAEPTLTARGVVFGTPAYMSPEQAAGMPADVGSDVYSAGVLLFELLAGRRPFVGETRADLLRAHLASDVPRLATVRGRLRAHPDLHDLIDVAMAKEPEVRFADGRDMLAALDAIDPPGAWLIGEHEISSAPTEPRGEPVEKPLPTEASGGRGGRLLMVLFAVVIFGGGLFFALREPPEPPAELEPEPAAHVLPADPFDRDMPEPLGPFVEMVESGYVFDDREEVGALYVMARELRGDPRPLLLIGHLFVNKGWLTEGLRRYERALAVDPGARGDRRMLANLIALSARGALDGAPEQLLVDTYGPEALEALEDAVTEHAETPIAQLRLVQLRDRLR